MKESKRLVVGLLVLTLLLVACSIVTAVRASRLERRLQQVEASYQNLEATHRAFAVTVSNAMLRPGASPYEVANARVEIARESMGLPPAAVIEMPPPGTERNSMPSGATVR